MCEGLEVVNEVFLAYVMLGYGKMDTNKGEALGMR